MERHCERSEAIQKREMPRLLRVNPRNDENNKIERHCEPKRRSNPERNRHLIFYVMRKIFVLFLLAGMFFRCVEPRVPGVVADDEPANIQTMDSLFEDTTKVLNVQIPSLVDSARQILIHEIYLESNMVNLIFEDLINQKKYLLTNNQIRISSYNTLIDKTGNKYFLYRVIDRDYNNDGKINSNDIGSLYISNIDGTSFLKLTKDREDVRYNENEWIHSVNRYYFKTLEDSNKDGFFDTKDKIHYYYIEFNEGNYKVVEYNPLEILNK